MRLAPEASVVLDAHCSEFILQLLLRLARESRVRYEDLDITPSSRRESSRLVDLACKVSRAECRAGTGGVLALEHKPSYKLLFSLPPGAGKSTVATGVDRR